MKKIFTITTLLIILSVLTLSAQSDNTYYLNMASEKLAANDCEAAQDYYDTYKILTNTSSPSLEEQITQCIEEKKKKNKTYRIGEVIENDYVVAYLDYTKKHGFAIKKNGIGTYKGTIEGILNETTFLISPPTVDECEKMYKNKYTLGLTGKYWAISKESITAMAGEILYDFSEGKYKKISSLSIKKYTANVLIVKRF